MECIAFRKTILFKIVGEKVKRFDKRANNVGFLDFEEHFVALDGGENEELVVGLEELGDLLRDF